jgi:PHD/YefM family antitoxin component YafN of YafNO toxin-antitoxin module
MKYTIRDLQAQYITDENGKKTAVILPIEEFEELLEDLQDLAVLAERRDEPTIPHEEVIAKLKRDGYLQD